MEEELKKLQDRVLFLEHKLAHAIALLSKEVGQQAKTPHDGSRLMMEIDDKTDRSYTLKRQ